MIFMDFIKAFGNLNDEYWIAQYSTTATQKKPEYSEYSKHLNEQYGSALCEQAYCKVYRHKSICKC